MGEMYREYLKSDDWQAKRKKRLKSGRRCVICSATERLDVHHVVYRDLYSVTTEDLRVLCRRCHTLTHRLLKSGALVYTSQNPGARFAQTKHVVMRHLKANDIKTPGGAVKHAIFQRATAKGGFTRAVLEEFGVPWPPPRGWLKNLGVAQ